MIIKKLFTVSWCSYFDHSLLNYKVWNKVLVKFFSRKDAYKEMRKIHDMGYMVKIESEILNNPDF